MELVREIDRPGENSRIGLQGTKIVIRKFHNLDALFRFPVVVLDASANQTIYKKLFGDREIEILELPVTLKAEVTQITNAPMGRESFSRNKPRFQTVLDFIRKSRSGRTGIICQLKYEAELRRGFPDAVMGHYGAIRGTRSFECCDTLFLVGGYFINLDELRQQAQALFWDEEKIDGACHKVAKNYGRRTDNKQIWGLYEFSDPRLQALADLYQTEEMRQAAFRIRPLAGKKKIFILSNIPITGLPPHNLIKLQSSPPVVSYRTFYDRIRYLHKMKRPYSITSISTYFEIPKSQAIILFEKLPEYLNRCKTTVKK